MSSSSSFAVVWYDARSGAFVDAAYPLFDTQQAATNFVLNRVADERLHRLATEWRTIVRLFPALRNVTVYDAWRASRAELESQMRCSRQTDDLRLSFEGGRHTYVVLAVCDDRGS